MNLVLLNIHYYENVESSVLYKTFNDVTINEYIFDAHKYTHNVFHSSQPFAGGHVI